MSYDVTKARIYQWVGIILIMAVFSGAYWYFKVYGSTLNQSQNDLNTNGLVGLWSFNGDDISGTTAYDRSGSGNNGTLTNGPVVTDGKVGQALDFWPNGSDTNAYVTMGDPASGVLDFGTGDFSVGFWMKGSGYSGQGSSANVALAKKNFVTFTNAGYGFWYGSTNLMSFTMANGTTAYSATQTVSTVADNQWHHYVGTRSGTSTITLYVDGVQVNNNATASGSVSNSVDFIAGTDSSVAPNDRNADAVIDEVRVYSTALSATEIQSLYTQGGGTKVNTAVSQPQGTGRLDSGLAGYWKLDDGSGTSATDSSTNGNTGTLTNGPTWTTGQIGGAVDLDGTNDYITTGTTLISADSITLSAWVNASGAKDGMAIFGNINGQTGSNRQCLIYDNAGVENLTFTDGLISLSITLGTGTWQHIVYTNRGTTNTLYLNGVKIAENTAGSLTTAAEQNVEIGSCVGSSGRTDYFQGKIDEARLYRRALSADEVAQLYRLNTPTSVDTSLKGYWSFNAPDMASTTAYDRSGAGNSGTLTNGPASTEGKLGQGLSFDGTDDYVSVADAAAFTESALTVSFWKKNTNVASNSKYVTKSATNQRSWSVESSDAGRNIRFIVSNSSSSESEYGDTPTGSMTAGEWYFVTCVFDGSGLTNAERVQIYINGVAQSVAFTGTIPASLVNNTQAVTLGGKASAAGFLGSLDEARIYNRALTVAEIKGLYDVGQSDWVNSSASQPQGTGRLDSGLAGYWKLDDGSGTSATDSSTNGNTGTLTNSPTWTTGQVGGAVNFDGVDDTLTTSKTIPNAGTVSLWVNTTAVLDSGDYYVSVGGATAGNSMFLRFNSYSGYNKWDFNMRGNFGTDVYVSGPTLTTDTQQGWHYLTAVWDTSKGASFYLDGTLLNSTTTTTDAFASMTLSIGNQSSNTWLGKIDEVRLYDRMLSADEVSQLYRLAVPTGVDTSLKGYWSFNGQDLSGTTAYDRSGSGNTGTLTSGPTITEGKIGQALQFDGTNDLVVVTNESSYRFSSDFSLSTWVKVPTTLAGYEAVIGKYAVTPSGWDFGIGSNGKARMSLRGTSTLDVSSGAGPDLRDNQWHHVVTVNTPTSIETYVDGILQNTMTGTWTATTNTDSLYIGNRDSNGTTTFSGMIDEVRVYNRALTESEIKALYNTSR